MNTINLKFFTGCAASLTLLCSFALCGCSGAENDISALECFAGGCDDEDGDHKDHGNNNENNHDSNGSNSNNERYSSHEDCDDHGLVQDFICDDSWIGRTLFEESLNTILVCEDTGNEITWEFHPELSNCSDYKANKENRGGLGGSSDSKGNSSSSTGSSNPLCGDLWCGPDHDKTVNTGFDDGTKTSGIWIDFGDYDKGGTSVVNVDEGTEKCPGLCGNVYLDNSQYSTPYAGLYFNLVNAFRDGANISSWNGFCMTGQIPSGTILELVHQQGEKIAPFVTYLESKGNSANVRWNDFIQELEEGQISLGRDDFLSQVAAIKIYWRSSLSTTIPFEITSIGTYGSCP